ncbi:MAG TPA: DUF1192 domain-containing protein [Hyphomicrobiaceae bacterium]|nr:DUF1192 domain-containing protein [Hyphomicrobiaceae bacterium]
MDWDDLKPKPRPAITLGQSLVDLSIAELEARVLALNEEIERVRAEIAAKKAHATAAGSIFKS